MVAISDHTAVSEGQSALLTCVAHGTPGLEVIWRYNNEIVANSSAVTVVSTESFSEGGEVFRQSTLLFCEVGMRTTGEYTCSVSVGFLSESATTSLTLTGKNF